MPSSSPEKNAAYQKKWYEKNKGLQIGRTERRKKEIVQWIKSHKSTLKCSQCGEDHPACLDFHHRDKSAKEINISSISRRGWSREKIMIEIEKCDVLCSNCHRKLHWDE